MCPKRRVCRSDRGGWSCLRRDRKSGRQRRVVYAVDAKTGDELWRTDVENRELPATPIDAVTYANGTLFFVNRGDAVLLALDAASGAIAWEVDLQKPSRGAPFVEGDTVFVSTGFDGGRIVAVDAATGENDWVSEEQTIP
ncbi:MAG: PQQ-binding-like beta-propeller repeat protein [Thermomicrobiales bacterium]